MGRMIVAVVVGVVLWGVLWNVGNAGLGSAGVIEIGTPITSVPVLLGLIAYSGVLSVLAGFVTATIKSGSEAMKAVRVLAGVNLLIGVVVEAMYWSLMPAWYHLVFLALVVPATIAGGSMKRPTPAAGVSR